MLAPDTFRFLNETRRILCAADWNCSECAHLWLYNLHYFDDLNAAGARSRSSWHTAWIERWVAENPPGTGAGWEPYPTSRRIVNWIKWSLGEASLSVPARDSLAVQARWLSQRLEHHLLANHLWVNAKALVFAGLYFGGPEARRWLEAGRAILARELPEQLLADGGQFERSPMYHAAALEDLLDLINLLRAYGHTPPPQWLAACESMRRWLAVMTHPDGEIAFFNDAAFGIAPNRAQLEAYAARLALAPAREPDEPLTVLMPSGYVRALAGAAYLVCDCAPLGPDYQLGHAHADTLSFELSLGGRRLFVNSGISRYGIGPERERQRGTAAHNTVTVDGFDSSEVWAGFRVARRAEARILSASASGGGISIAAKHDGYRRLAGRNQHTRYWLLREHALDIEDEVSGSYSSAVAFLHLHPDVGAIAAGHEVQLQLAAGPVAHVTFEHADAVEVEPSTWQPAFGAQIPSRRIVARFGSGRLLTRVRWDTPP